MPQDGVADGSRWVLCFAWRLSTTYGLAARLVVGRFFDASGKLPAEWFLLTSVPETVEDARIALWYYFRWQIESFFKLLKQAGHHLEQWAQESGCAIFKHLPIATQACVLVWRLARQNTKEAGAARGFLADK